MGGPVNVQFDIRGNSISDYYAVYLDSDGSSWVDSGGAYNYTSREIKPRVKVYKGTDSTGGGSGNQQRLHLFMPVIGRHCRG